MDEGGCGCNCVVICEGRDNGSFVNILEYFLAFMINILYCTVCKNQKCIISHYLIKQCS